MKNKRKKVSHYLINEQLNRGNFGTVYKGIDTENSELRAIKVISNKNLFTPRQKQALNREVQIMLNLQHENIVKLYDHIETTSNNYLILEYCKNGDLSQFNSGIGEERTVFYLRQIVKGLKVMHECNIIHRDLKPANIFLLNESRVKIGDFGLSRTMSLENVANSYVGTPNYMAPEVFMVRNSPNDRYNFKADIWSLGCIIYELITGKKPFETKDTEEMIPFITTRVNSTKFLVGEFSEDCSDLLRKIFKVNPDERISFEELCEHRFILGMPSIASIVDLSGIQCLNEDLTVLTAEDALEIVRVILEVADYSNHPFLMYMKACIIIKPYLCNNKCFKIYGELFKKAEKTFDLTEWETSTVSREILETVVQICKADEGTAICHLRENLKYAYVLLKCLKASPFISSLKESLKKQISL